MLVYKDSIDFLQILPFEDHINFSVFYNKLSICTSINISKDNFEEVSSSCAQIQKVSQLIDACSYDKNALVEINCDNEYTSVRISNDIGEIYFFDKHEFDIIQSPVLLRHTFEIKSKALLKMLTIFKNYENIELFHYKDKLTLQCENTKCEINVDSGKDLKSSMILSAHKDLIKFLEQKDELLKIHIGQMFVVISGLIKFYCA